MNIKDWQLNVNELAKNKGWWDDWHDEQIPKKYIISTKLALIMSEAAEALDDVRTSHMKTTVDVGGKPCGFPTELADVVIRVLDLAEQLGIDLEEEIKRKHEYNVQRSFMHGGKAL